MALLETWTLSFQCNWLSKLKEAQENWKRTLQTTVFKGGLTSGVGHNNQSPPPESSLTNWATFGQTTFGPMTFSQAACFCVTFGLSDDSNYYYYYWSIVTWLDDIYPDGILYDYIWVTWHLVQRHFAGWHSAVAGTAPEKNLTVGCFVLKREKLLSMSFVAVDHFSIQGLASASAKVVDRRRRDLPTSASRRRFGRR